jgi:hypothetical protein
MNDRQEPDEPLVADLREYFARVDPVPPLVTEAAKAALGWRHLDADLTELLAGSTLEAESLATVRGVGVGATARRPRSVQVAPDASMTESELRTDGPRSTSG